MTTNRAILKAIAEQMGEHNLSFQTRRYLHFLIAKSATKEAPGGGRSGIEQNHTTEKLKLIMENIKKVTTGRSSLPRKFGLTPEIVDEVYHNLNHPTKESD